MPRTDRDPKAAPHIIAGGMFRIKLHMFIRGWKRGALHVVALAPAVMALAALHGVAQARGVTPYLPLNLDPEIEGQVERVLILADKPVMTRPIPLAVVVDALPKACQADAVLCARVRRFLGRYMRDSGISFASAEGAVSSGADPVMPNQHGRGTSSHYQLAGGVYLQPNDYMLLSVGGVAYEGRAVATGSVISLGFDRAQLDIGFRDHWLSPMTDSAMVISTEAPTMPSVTLSNYTPLTRLGLQYEMFLARLSRSDQIVFNNGFTSGYPHFAGFHLGIEPASGWSLAANRIVVFGGGARGGQSLNDLLRAFFNPGQAQNDPAAKHSLKQQGSVTSRFIFPGRTPFAVYFEYAGNDTSHNRNYLLGKNDLSAGIHFPHLGPFDLTYEISDWQDTWYVDSVLYHGGIVNYGRVTGHWFGDQRQFGDAVGGQSNMLRLGWEPPFGGVLEAQIRTLTNASYSSVPYRHEINASVRYSYPWKDFIVGGEVDLGHDVFGERFTRLAGFLRLGDGVRGSSSDSQEHASQPQAAGGAEVFLDAGMNVNQVQVDLTDLTPRTKTPVAYAPHLAFGARRAVAEHQDLGVRIELDDINRHTLIGVRALDYRYRFAGPLALSAFIGAARYALATPAYGIYLGGGAQWRNVLPGWDLGLDLRQAVKVARDHVLPTDPHTARPDSFYDITSATLYVTHHF
jgi:hypothetical protein